MFARMLHRLSSSHAARRTKRHLTFEPLEGRQLMSIGPKFMVDSGNNGTYKDAVATASSSNGSSVVVWVESAVIDNGKGLGYSDIWAQYYNAAGNKVGAEISVAYQPVVNEYAPAVAMDAHGDFVVSWTYEEPDGHTDILAQTFNASAVPIGTPVQVAVGTFNQYESSVAMDANGNFIVAYVRDTNNNNPDVFAKAYYSTGQLKDVITVAASPCAESNPSIAMDPAGAFDVAYQVQNGAANDVYVARYSQNDGLLGALEVTTGSVSDDLPSIAMDTAGAAVVAYGQSADFNGYNPVAIYAKRISATGVVSSPILVGEYAYQVLDIGPGPSVEYQESGGFFAVAYDESVNGGPLSVVVDQASPANIVVESDNLGPNLDASISALGSYAFVVAYASFGNGNSLNNDVYGQFGFYY